MYYWKPSQPVNLGGGNINNLGGRLNERGTFIRINPGICDEEKVDVVCHDKILADKRLICKGPDIA